MNRRKVGSYEWMMASQGQLSFKEKVQLIRRLIIPNIVASVQIQWYKHSNNQHACFDLDQVVIPDTPMVKIAVEELAIKASVTLINHSWRTYFWAVALAHMQQKEYDPESLLVAALFHDIGLTEAHLKSKGCKCFCYESADQFRIKAQQINFDQQKMHLIQEAICLHMNGYRDDSYANEIVLLQQGASCDVIGAKLYTLSSQYKEHVLAQYPRADFNRHFTQLINMESQLNPHSRTALLKHLGLSSMIKLNIFEE